MSEEIIKIPSTISVKDLAKLLNVPASAVITELMKNKIMATINEEIDYDTAAIISSELGFETQEDLEVDDDETITLEKVLEICAKERETDRKLPSRPPIVTILGHVDHGKTTLLDTIRRASVAEGEAGGITQHISAYQTKKRGKQITFVDTPGHEAFAAMRERGVSIADIAILVVAADDGVRPQTEEVIKYLIDKDIPTIVAINKIDKPGANPMRVKQELADKGIIIEEWGGKVMCAEVSAKNNIAINDLLESVILLADVEDFRADEERSALAVVLESHLDPQKGPIATVLLKTGTLRVGQDITSGKTYGRIKRMEDWNGQSITKALPSMPVTIFGLSDTAETNDIIQVASGKSHARLKSQETADRLAGGVKNVKSANDNPDIPKLNIVVKVDVPGSLEAIDQIISTYPQGKVAVNFIGTGVGDVTESDIKLAESGKAVIYAFNVNVRPVAKRLAEESDLETNTYKVIYELVEDVKERMIKLLPDETERTDIGQLEILGIFFTDKGKMIVGGRVTKGKVIAKDVKIDVLRGLDEEENPKVIGSGELANLQHNKVDIDEVKKDKECGITFTGETKIKIGDTFAFYHEKLLPKEL